MTFDPSTASSEDSTVYIYDNATGSPQQVPLTGQGIASTAKVSKSKLNFGSQTLGITSNPKTIKVTNTGTKYPLVMWGYCGEGCGNNPNISGGNSGNYSITDDGCSDERGAGARPKLLLRGDV